MPAGSDRLLHSGEAAAADAGSITLYLLLSALGALIPAFHFGFQVRRLARSACSWRHQAQGPPLTCAADLRRWPAFVKAP